MIGEGADAVGGPWYPAGPAWEPFVRTDRVSGITAAEIQSPEPEPLARRWSEMAEIDLTVDAEGHPLLEIDNATVRFVDDEDGRGEGLGGIDVTTVDGAAIREGAAMRGCYVDDDRVDLVGLRIYLR